MSDLSPPVLRGVRAHVYRAFADDHSGGGISARCSQVTLVGPDVPGLHPADEDAPAVRLVVTTDVLPVRVPGPVSEHVAEQLSRIRVPVRRVHLEPLDAPHPLSHGGTFVSGDGRFLEAVVAALGSEPVGAVPLHDRSGG